MKIGVFGKNKCEAHKLLEYIISGLLENSDERVDLLKTTHGHVVMLDGTRYDALYPKYDLLRSFTYDQIIYSNSIGDVIYVDDEEIDFKETCYILTTCSSLPSEYSDLLFQRVGVFII